MNPYYRDMLKYLKARNVRMVIYMVFAGLERMAAKRCRSLHRIVYPVREWLFERWAAPEYRREAEKMFPLYYESVKVREREKRANNICREIESDIIRGLMMDALQDCIEKDMPRRLRKKFEDGE